jgi:hypothetical protein
MAEIPVERKEGSSFPWWLIPLLLLLLLLPLLYFCNRGAAVVDNTNHNGNANRGANVDVRANGNMVGGTTTTTTTTSDTGNTAVVMNGNNGGANNMTDGASGGGSTTNMNRGAVIKDVNEFGSASDKTALVGRGFFVNGVRVEQVLSDKVFTVKSGSGEMFVVLGEGLDSGGGKEKQIKPRRGQMINLGGEFRNVPTGEVKEETQGGGLNKNEYARMKGQNVYLHANSLSDTK